MIAIFVSQTALDKVLPLPSGVEIGTPIQSLDGRVAICHGFPEEDLAVLIQEGAAMVDSLPEDWQYPQA